VYWWNVLLNEAEMCRYWVLLICRMGSDFERWCRTRLIYTGCGGGAGWLMGGVEKKSGSGAY
jgi:hypothetical protein